MAEMLCEKITEQVVIHQQRLQEIDEQLVKARNAVIVLGQQLAAEQATINTLHWLLAVQEQANGTG